MSGLLEARGITCGYRGRSVLTDLCLHVERGKVLALIGPNGAGKTTLLRTLGRLLRPERGSMLLDGVDLWRLAPRAVARRLALAPQMHGGSWQLTVEQTVGLGRAPHRGWLLPLSTQDREAVNRAMRRMDVDQFRERMMHELSGGEQRRVILARALAQAADILLLDEPTAYLDLRYQMEILQLARGMARDDGRAVVITLHDLNHAAMCADRVALLAGGQLQLAGTPEEVLTPARIEHAYGVPVVVTPNPIDGTPLVTPVAGLASSTPETEPLPFLQPTAILPQGRS
ncbi:MAG TPA: ABC transporter ATP-binding protein [Herpetosiphonaceae bacterium]|nr:ABC transporter ATP-binding protein [Herpetosiphonaceae bacterium]